MKKLTSILALLAGTSIACQAAVNLVPNGDFETPGGAGWISDGPSTESYPATGGNSGGYGALDSSTGWGVFVVDGNLGDLGIAAGGTYDFVFDMIDLGAGGGLAGIKLESWNGAGFIGDSGDRKSNATTSWATYTESYTVDAAATFVKFVPLSVDGANVGFDNIGVNVVPEPSAILLLGGSFFVGLLRRRR